MKKKILKAFLLFFLALGAANVLANNCQSTWHWLIKESNYDDPSWDSTMDFYIQFCL